MIKVYNNETSTLRLEYRDLVKFDLNIRKYITQINGDSGTGKTLLVDCINTIAINNETNDIEFDVSNIKLITNKKSISELKDASNCLIIIDRADLLLTDEITEFIYKDMDRGNTYLIFGRKAHNFHLSPNYYGEFVKSADGVLRINYKYSESSWF